jgi:hypothetical protein
MDKKILEKTEKAIKDLEKNGFNHDEDCAFILISDGNEDDFNVFFKGKSIYMIQTLCTIMTNENNFYCLLKKAVELHEKMKDENSRDTD